MVFNTIDLGDTNTPDDKEFQSILSPPGNYLSPASLDSNSSYSNGNKFTIGNSFERHTLSVPTAPASIINDRLQPFDYLYNNKLMAAIDNPEIKKEENSPNSETKSNSTNLPDSDTNAKKTNIVKRKYSRNGCAECKRRRMKCDETKPICWQCARLSRECVYIVKSGNKKRKSKSAGESAEKRCKKPMKEDSSSAEENKYTKEFVREQRMNSFDQRSLEVPNLIPASTMDGYDVNLLMQNLNDMVSMKLNDSFLLNEGLKDLDLPDLGIPDLLPSHNPPKSSVPISFLVNNSITFNTDITSIKLGGVHDTYLKVFYYDCLDSIAPFFQEQANPLRDILLSFARNESYLMSAILAVGASISHRKTGNIEDERNYCAYLSHCLSLLGEQFKNESNVINKIEPIILTVIMLAWDCIYTMNSQWRSHLKGVTDLFKKITVGNSSKVLNVAKCWFKVMETFASISTVLGGSVTDDSDLDLVFDPYNDQYVDSLKSLNIMTPLNEFNLLRGHKEDFDLVIKEVIKALSSIRSSEKAYFSEGEGIFTKNQDYLSWSTQESSEKSKTSLSYFKTQKILVEIDRQLEYEFIDKSGIIPPNSQSHPNNSHIEDNAIDIVTLRSGEQIAISWYDISHQTQVLSFLLIVLLKLLGIPKESITIQQVVQRIMSFFKFLDSDSPPQNLRTCYCNFAVLIAGLNAMDEKTRDIVRDYYKLNGSKFQRLTKHNLNRLEKVWYSKDGSYKLADQDVLTW
ncbi:hypothetical protein NCAS_0A10550 [Naumovozyma castellii]|uniref:Zn(2)-C6 fungal-type domain-containing protein n=1 Tax=Naumovozyma castellii TaxID=27288 RepID=G0V815_NAUCA|nr:hypothetical protein NCAS_0A10550 [Naumovozyma castellii CBS 4309]CCC67613.1 hypothetical protein NCAS_0A10550 [Naumovozyma castellii CBS 4309]